MDPRLVVFLIHGVGNPAPGSIRQALMRHASSLGLEDADVVEINWNALVSSGIERRRIDHAWLADLARSMQSTAGAGFDPADRRCVTTGTARLQDPLAVLLRVVAAGAPLLLLWGLLCLLFSAIQTDGGTPWAGYRLEPAANRAWWAWIAFAAYPLTIGRWSSLWLDALVYWAALVAFLCASIVVLGAFDRTQGSFVASLRRGVLLALAPLAYAVGLPFVMRWITSVGILAYLALTTLIGVPAYEPSIVSSSTVYLEAGLSLTDYVKWDQLRLTALVLLLAIVIAVCLLFVASPILKVLADIFRYLGSSDYRSRMHDGLRTLIGDKLTGLEQPRVVVAGHSLGSVIALDALRSRQTALDGIEQLDLVTAGSPLLRLFHRFFPADYARPGAELERLWSANPGLRWINAYRPLDYVGGRLGSEEEGVLDIRIPQRLRLHTNYWGDPCVVQQVQHALGGPRDAGGPLQPGRPFAWGRCLGAFRGLPPHWRGPLVVGLGLVTAVNFLVTEPLQRRANFEAQVEALAARGDETRGKLYRVQREVWEQFDSYAVTDVVEEFWARFESANGETVTVQLDERFHDAAAISRALAALEQTQPVVPTDMDAVGADVWLRYLDGDPVRAHAPAYYRESFFSLWRIPGAVLQFLIGALFAVIPVTILDSLLAPQSEI